MAARAAESSWSADHQVSRAVLLAREGRLARAPLLQHCVVRFRAKKCSPALRVRVVKGVIDISGVVVESASVADAVLTGVPRWRRGEADREVSGVLDPNRSKQLILV